MLASSLWAVFEIGNRVKVGWQPRLLLLGAGFMAGNLFALALSSEVTDRPQAVVPTPLDRVLAVQDLLRKAMSSHEAVYVLVWLVVFLGLALALALYLSLGWFPPTPTKGES